MNIKIIALFCMAVTGYTAWTIMAWNDASLRANFLTFNIDMVGGVVALALRDMPPPKPKDSP